MIYVVELIETAEKSVLSARTSQDVARLDVRAIVETLKSRGFVPQGEYSADYVRLRSLCGSYFVVRISEFGEDAPLRLV